MTAYLGQNSQNFFFAPTNPFIIGICGGSSSGKTTLARKIKDFIGPSATILHQDSYYIDQSQRFDGDGGTVNFDHPDAIDFILLKKHLESLKKGASIEVPIYDFTTHSRLKKSEHFSPTPIIILEGFLILDQKEIRSELNHSIFLETTMETRLSRRIHRDTVERGRHIDGVKKQFFNQVEPMHEMFVEPSKQFANTIIKNHLNETESLTKLHQQIESHFKLKKTPLFFQSQTADFHSHLQEYQLRA